MIRQLDYYKARNIRYFDGEVSVSRYSAFDGAMDFVADVLLTGLEKMGLGLGSVV